jgi:Fe-S oxidoreductase
VAKHALLFEELIADLAGQGHLDLLHLEDSGPKQVLIHGHCHQKALATTESTRAALALIPGAIVSEIPSGCCGMAGSFGYQHHDISMAIGEQVLFPAVRAAAPDTVLVASGTSCRQQILDGTGKRALHPAQVLRKAMA